MLRAVELSNQAGQAARGKLHLESPHSISRIIGEAQSVTNNQGRGTYCLVKVAHLGEQTQISNRGRGTPKAL